MKKTSLTVNPDYALLNLSSSLARLQLGYRAAVNRIVASSNSGVTPRLAWPLVMLAWHGDDLPASRLAEMLDIKTSTLTRLLAQLVNEGLIAYSKDRINRKVTTVCLTPAGAVTSAKIGKAMYEFRNALFEDIPDMDVNVCLHLFSILEHRMETRSLTLASQSESIE